MSEVELKEEFCYDRWYEKQALELARLLMEALHVANNINEADSLWEVIKEKIESLDLPNQKCKKCGKEMKHWDWAIRQGYCDSCIKELEEKMRHEWSY